MSWIPLDTVVRDAQERLGYEHNHMYSKIYKYMVRGVQEVHTDFGGKWVVKRKWVDVQDGRAYMPEDFVNYVQVGVVDRGNLIALTVNPIMAAPTFDDCGNIPRVNGGDPQQTEYSGPQSRSTQWAGYDLGNWNDWYGASAHGGGWSRDGNYYKFNAEKGWIDFNSKSSVTQIVLDYISTGYKPGEKNHVHVFWREFLILYAMWQMKLYESFRKPSLMGAVNQWERKTAIERLKTYKRCVTEPMYEWSDMVMRQFGRGPKPQ